MQKQLFTYLLLASSLFAIGQKPAEEGSAKPGAFNRALSLDQKVEKTGEVTIKGQKVPYKVT